MRDEKYVKLMEYFVCKITAWIDWMFTWFTSSHRKRISHIRLQFFTSSWDKQSVCWPLIALVCKLYGIFYQATTVWFIYLAVYNYFVFWVGSRTHHVVWWAFEMPSAWKNTSFSTQGSYRLDLFFDNVSIYILQNGNELVKFQLVYMLFPLYILFCWCTSKWVFLM